MPPGKHRHLGHPVGASASASILLLAGALHPVLSGPPALSAASSSNAPAELRRPEPRDAARDRGPVAVGISPNGQFCATANRRLQTVSLINLRTARLVDEVCLPGLPVDVAWVNDNLLAVSLKQRRAVALVHRDDPGFSRAALVELRHDPHGLATAAWPMAEVCGDRGTVWVALPNADEVAVIDAGLRSVVSHLPTAPRPMYLALSANGAWLATTCTGTGELCVHERATGRLLSRRALFDEPANLGVPALTPDAAACIVPHIAIRAFPVNEENIEKGWVIDNRLTRMPLPGGEYWNQRQMGLDPRGNAAGDAHACAISADGQWLAVTCGGTHELLILALPRIPWPSSNPGDFIPPELLGDDQRFRRLKLGGRPQGAVFKNARTLLVANDFLNCVQVIDVVEGALTTTLNLSAPARPSAARRGEEIFYDAERSLHGWFSCHTCHVDGHTSERVFDTLNDGSYDTYKLTPTLRGATQTGPWTWHGRQRDLKAALRKSMKETMRSTRPFTDAEVDDLYEFLKSLEWPANPSPAADEESSRQAERGRLLFAGKGGCAHCHQEPHLTSERSYDVGTGSRRYIQQEFNPPSLRGLFERRRFLHDGRANSLIDLLERHHQPQSAAKGRLDHREIEDLVAYLKTL